ncbi:hypothetical protein ABPG77_007954 [Micractinium sp. CCAP 211/92]
MAQPVCLGFRPPPLPAPRPSGGFSVPVPKPVLCPRAEAPPSPSLLPFDGEGSVQQQAAQGAKRPLKYCLPAPLHGWPVKVLFSVRMLSCAASFYRASNLSASNLSATFYRASNLSAGPSVQMELLSLDGGATRWPWEVAYRRTIVASGARYPNGCRIPMTWFTSCCHGGRQTGECEIAQAAYAAGHELATHTMTHPDER